MNISKALDDTVGEEIRQLIKEFPDAVLLVSTTGEILAWSRKAVGLLRGGIPGSANTLQEFVSGPAAPLLDYLKRCSRTNERTPGAFFLKSAPDIRLRLEGSGMQPAECSSERVVWLRLSAQEQAIRQFLLLNERIARLDREVHARLSAESNLVLQAARLEKLVNEAPVGVTLVDSELRILQMNPTAMKIFGSADGMDVINRGLDEVLGQLWPPHHAKEMVHSFRRTLESGEPHIGKELVVERTDECAGTTYEWQVHRIPISGQDHGAVCYVGDVSERKRAEEALRENEKLAATGRLAATIAHEINNPLEAITNLLYLVKNNPSLDEEASGYVAQADSELRRIAHVTRQSLGFYRDSMAPIFFEPAEVIDSVLDIYRYKIDEQDVKLIRDLQRTAPVYGFVGEFRQVVSNLIVNAIDAAAAKGGRICVRTRSGRRWNGNGREGVRIAIADSGPGIPSDLRGRVFDAFFTTKTDVGTGLGLWLSREIVQKHEGRLRVRSRISPPRNGTTFSIFWPYYPEG